MAIEDYQSLAPSSRCRRVRRGFLRAARVAFFALTASSALLVSSVTRAAGNVSVRYRAPSACPDQRNFEAELDRRLGEAPRPNTVLDVDVSVNEAAPEASRVFGRLLRDGRPLRQLEGSTCDEIVKALALVAALAILPPEPGTPATAPAGPGPGDAPPAKPEGRGRRGPGGDAVPEPPPRGAIFVAVGGYVDGLSAPEPSFGGNLAVAVRLPGPATSPVLFVDASIGAARGSAVGPVRTDFSRAGGRAGACPLGFVLGPFLARPCAALSVDRVHGESSGIATPRTANAVFASGHLFGRLSLPLASERVSIGASAGALVPFAPPLFIVEDPVVEVHRVPRVAFLGQLDVAVRVF